MIQEHGGAAPRLLVDIFLTASAFLELLRRAGFASRLRKEKRAAIALSSMAVGSRIFVRHIAS